MTEAHVRKQLALGCTRKRGARELNPRPVDRKCSALYYYATEPTHTVYVPGSNFCLMS